MTNEQIIYLGPEEELTSVRERLEGAQAGRIMLVIPPQTQLRSHLGWRLLYSRMRELGKDVLVISSDRQIRTVAQNAGFRVADSRVADAKETSASNKQRPASRQAGTDMGGKRIQRSRNQPDRGSTAHRIMWSKRPNQSQLATNNRQQAPQSRGETGSKISRADEVITGSGTAASSTFEIHDEQLTQPYESHIDTSPSIHPLAPELEDEEFDPLKEGIHIEDVQFAQHIREAALSIDAGAVQPSSEIREPSSDRPEQHTMLHPAGEMDEDLFAYMEDIQPVSLPEQRASTFIHDLDPEIADITEVPTEAQEFRIDDLGDQGEIVAPQDLGAHPGTEPAVEELYEEETPRLPGVRPRQSRMGSPARPSIEDFDDQDMLLPPEQPARVTPSSGALLAGALASSTAGSRQPKPPAQARNVNITPTTQQAKKPAATKASRKVTVPPVSNAAPSIFSHRSSRYLVIAFISLAVIVLALLAFLYYGSNATVTITVPTQTLSLPQPVQYEASTNQQDTQHNTIPSQEVPMDIASVMGQGTASGPTTQQGNAKSTGTVIFTNNGSQALDIPTGTEIETSETSSALPVKFVTTADALVEPASGDSPTPVVPIQAENPGDSGNVAANAINMITSNGNTTIMKAPQNSGIVVNLKVTNPDPTSGVSVPSVTSSDINALEKTLHQQLQTQITGWLATVLHQKYVKGTLMPDVLGSSTPLKEEKLVTTPAAPNGIFSGVLSVTVPMLVIPDASIQAAGRSQLNAIALKMKPAFVLATQRPVNVTVTKSSASPDGKTLSITVTASGQIMQQVSAKAISNLVAGKPVNQAKSDITGGKAGINGVVDTRIAVFPSLLGIMPFRPEQIHVIVQP